MFHGELEYEQPSEVKNWQYGICLLSLGGLYNKRLSLTLYRWGSEVFSWTMNSEMNSKT